MMRVPMKTSVSSVGLLPACVMPPSARRLRLSGTSLSTDNSKERVATDYAHSVPWASWGVVGVYRPSFLSPP